MVNAAAEATPRNVPVAATTLATVPIASTSATVPAAEILLTRNIHPAVKPAQGARTR